MSSSPRLITIRCAECGHNVGTLEDGLCSCDACGADVQLSAIRLEHLGYSGKRNPEHLRDANNPFFARQLSGRGRNRQQQDPQPLKRPVFNMRLDGATHLVLNKLIALERRTAADIVRDAVAAYAERQGIDATPQ